MRPVLTSFGSTDDVQPILALAVELRSIITAQMGMTSPIEHARHFGDPPIVITFGSVMRDNPDAVTGLLPDAVARANCRAIIQHGWSGLARGQLPKNLVAVGFTPHAWLLPRAACVVHHGGAGATAATFRAGVPAIIIPHTLDQPVWAEFACSLHCAGGVIPYSQLSAERLGMAIAKTLVSSSHRQAAVALIGHQLDQSIHRLDCARQRSVRHDLFLGLLSLFDKGGENLESLPNRCRRGSTGRGSLLRRFLERRGLCLELVGLWRPAAPSCGTS